jgi:hypothetical protein
VIGLDSTQDHVLTRFADELDEQAPYPLVGRPDLSRYTEADLREARLTWAGRVLDEYRSVVVFSQLLHLLADAGAPYAALCAIQRLIGDELRHSKLCAQVVEWLGGAADLRLDVEGMGVPPAPSHVPSAARAYEIVVRELVVAEHESLHVLRAYRDATTDPAINRVLQVILCDEARHYVTGRQLQRLLDHTVPARTLDPVRARLPDVIKSDLEHIRSAYLRSAGDGPGRALGACIRPDEMPFSGSQRTFDSSRAS